MNDIEMNPSPEIEVIGRTTHIRFHFHQVTVSTRSSLAAGTPHWVPPVDLYETEREIFLEVCLAGVTSDEVHLQFTGREVRISGTRHDATEPLPRNYYVMEIERGRFARTVELPVPVEPETVKAKYADGLLIVTAAKRGGSIGGCVRAITREGLE